MTIPGSTETRRKDFRRAVAAALSLVILIALGGCALHPRHADAEAGIASDPPLTESPPAPRSTVAATYDASGPTATVSPAADIRIRDDAPGQYIVKKGDTLWDIAGRFLADPWYWPEIWHANPDIKNPHLIYPGDVISLYYVNGQPRLGVNYSGPSGVGKLEPRIRSTQLNEENAGIPVSVLRPFLIRPRIIAEEQLKQAPHILDSTEHRLVYASNDRVYVRNLGGARVGERYSVFKPGGEIHDPVTHEMLGYEAVYAGEAEVEAVGEPATVRLKHTVREILRGDRLLPLDAGATGMHFWPHAPAAGVEGRVISVFDALHRAAQYQPVAINLGKRNGVEPGHVFAVDQQGRIVDDRYHRKGQSATVELPTEKTGIALVFRTFDKISYALIMKSVRPVRIGDLVRRP